MEVIPRVARNYVGMPAAMYLEEFGSQVMAAFDETPYLVGSATRGREFRDVDVRLLLDDDMFAKMFGCDPNYSQHNGKWVAFCAAFSELGRRMTGLPIDFQIQQRTRANEQFASKDGHYRLAPGFTPLRVKGPAPNEQEDEGE